jgi:hypothetical protein
MNARAAHWLTRLYPPVWRARYGEEFQTFLEVHPNTPSAVLNVIACALHERVCRFGEFDMSKLQHSLVLTVYAYLAAVSAGVNLVGSVDDTALSDAMRTHTALFACWNLVAAASLVALVAVLTLGLPALWAMIRFAMTNKRHDILVRLAFPPCAAVVLLSWIIAVVMKTGWLPLFWDVAGDWATPGGWPSPQVRWVLSSVTLTLVVGGLLGTAISLKQAIQRSTLSEQQWTLFGRVVSLRPLQLAKIPTLILAGSIVLMALGVAGWGLLADQYMPAAFHARDGGFFGAPNIVSWMGTLALFVASAVTALRGARWAISSQAD